ncbi:multidrug efflux system subunit MdtA [Raoultella planticola]|uniref:Multidrug efflux system subunit MdtA n=1 Tax=Raoultella planticola TaxID=575 RepID=A0A485AMW5_RAOPL|nr:multidrug efflux system subunit MdtA [Raoultella planticola]
MLNDENKVSKHTVTPGIQDSLKVVITPGCRQVTGWSLTVSIV